MVFHLTAKLAKKLNTGKLGPDGGEANDALRWYVTFFRTSRQHYILTTHGASLLSVAMFSRGITDFSMFQKQFFASLHELLDGYGLGSTYQHAIALHAGKSFFYKTNNRSVLGSMNDMIFNCQYVLAQETMSLPELSRYINQIPFSAIGYQHPEDAFKAVSWQNLSKVTATKFTISGNARPSLNKS